MKKEGDVLIYNHAKNPISLVITQSPLSVKDHSSILPCGSLIGSILRFRLNANFNFFFQIFFIGAVKYPRILDSSSDLLWKGNNKFIGVTQIIPNKKKEKMEEEYERCLRGSTTFIEARKHINILKE